MEDIIKNSTANPEAVPNLLLDATIQALRELVEKGTGSPNIPEELRHHPQFQQLLNELLGLKRLAQALSDGDLSQIYTAKGAITACLKNLQANLRHLTWQTQQIARGDFSLRVDFMGEFSAAFNSMVASLDEMHSELRESEEFHKAVIENSPIGISVRSRTGQLLFANQAWRKIWAIPEQDVQEDQLERPELSFNQRDEYLKPYQDEVRRVYEYGGHLHLPGLHPTQTRPGAAQWISQHFYAIQDEHGQVERVVILTEDITEQRIAHEIEHDQRILSESLRDIAAALNSTLDFEHVLDKIMTSVSRVVPHDTASIMMMDENGEVHVIRERGYAERGLSEKISASRFFVSGTPYLNKMLHSSEPVIVPDTALDPDWLDLKIARVASYVGIPILQKGKVVGFINLGSETPGFFSSAHLERLRSFSDQAAIAIENAQLYEQAQRHARQTTSLYQIGLSITSTLDRTQILRDLFTQIQQVLTPDVFYIAIYNERKHRVEHPQFYDSGKLLNLPSRDIRKRPGLTGEVILTRKTIIIHDLLDRQQIGNRRIIRVGGNPSRTYVGVPMLIRDQVVGVLSIQSYKPNAFSLEQVRLLETIAAQAAIAVENSRLFERAQDELAQRRATQSSLQKANRQMKRHIKKIESLQIELHTQAIRDGLTGLFNRRYLQETLEREIARAARKRQPVGIIMLDVDLFKTVNDTYGHQAGDFVLQTLSKLLMSNIRAEDIVCRYGGEEFVVVMPGADVQVTQERAEFIRAEFESMRVPYGEDNLRATVSLGVAAYPAHASDGEETLIYADRALYFSKQNGRNRVTVFREDIRLPAPKI